MHGNDFLLHEWDIETLSEIGTVMIDSLGISKLEKMIALISDSDGNRASFTIVKDQDIYRHENGNSLRIYWGDDAPPVQNDIAPTEKELSESKENGYLLTIAAMLKFCEANRITQDILAEWIDGKFKKDIYELRVSTLTKRFADANEIFNEKLKG